MSLRDLEYATVDLPGQESVVRLAELLWKVLISSSWVDETGNVYLDNTSQGDAQSTGWMEPSTFPVTQAMKTKCLFESNEKYILNSQFCLISLLFY